MASLVNKNYKEHLVIPDSHAKPGVDNDRFEWIGHLIVERKPDVIIDIGDSADMPSLSVYEKGSVTMEGRRYRDDLEAYHDAQRRLFGPIQLHNNTFTRWKKRTYKPKFIKTRGNHEHRIVRAAEADPKFYGHVQLSDLKEEEFGWDCYDIGRPAFIDGVAYSHFFTSGLMGRPIAAPNHARKLVQINHKSSVCGHSHIRDFHEEIDVLGNKLFGLVVGCYFGHDEHWTTENKRYWRGLYYLRDVDGNGAAEPEPLTYEYMKARYG